MKLLIGSIALLALLGGAACTTRGVYEGLRSGERQRCDELKDTEREQCRAKTQDDFDTYNRKREAEAS